MRRVQMLTAALGVGLAVAALSVAPAAAAPSAVAGYNDPENSARSRAETREFFDAAMESARERGALDGMSQGFAVTLTYSDGGAPSFQEATAAGAAVWNGVLTAVQLREVESGGDFTVDEGDDPRLGSHVRLGGLGKGAILLDRRQLAANDPVRVVAHEIGHVLGLPDIRSGVCSELMSGGSAGTSCRSSQPNAQEIATVENNFGGPVAPEPEPPVTPAPEPPAPVTVVDGRGAPSEALVSSRSRENGAGIPGGADAQFPPGVVFPVRAG